MLVSLKGHGEAVWVLMSLRDTLLLLQGCSVALLLPQEVSILQEKDISELTQQEKKATRRVSSFSQACSVSLAPDCRTKRDSGFKDSTCWLSQNRNVWQGLSGDISLMIAKHPDSGWQSRSLLALSRIPLAEILVS